MIAEERRQKLVKFVAESGFASLQDMIDFLQVSESTIRRDLTALEEQGQIRRTRGGAVFVNDSPQVLTFSKRQTSQLAEKQAMALAAAQLVQEGETILLHGGTTVYELAKSLSGKDLQIVTNSLPVAALFSNRPEVELIVIGGYLYPRTEVMLGPLVKAVSERIHVNKAFFSPAAVTADGMFNVNLMMAETDRELMRCAETIVVLADHTKFGKQSLARVADLKEIDMLVSDWQLADEHRRMLNAAGVEVIVAEPAKAETSAGNR